MRYIYFDNAATTRQSDEVTAEIDRCATQNFYNSAALYGPSLEVKNQIERARDVIRHRLTKTGEGELVFTSGATESNNMVIFGKINSIRQHILLLEGEHASAYQPVKNLKDSGYCVDMIPLLKNGRADLDALACLLDSETALVVFGFVNSDTGTIQDAKSIVRTVRSIAPRAHIHCDATQAFCKIPFDVTALGIDSMSVSAHKIHGPKGIGALWLRKGVNLHPIMIGGGQQPLRPGTENNPAIMGFAKAAELFDTNASFMRVSELHEHLVRNLPAGCAVNGINNNPYITNIGLPNILGQTVMNALSEIGILVGLGSACSSRAQSNRTLLAMGLPEQKTKQVLRISFCASNTIEEVDIFLNKLKQLLIDLK